MYAEAKDQHYRTGANSDNRYPEEMPKLAAHIDSVASSGIRAIYEVAITLDDVIMLAVGEPDVPVAPHITAAAKAAWDVDDTNYTATPAYQSCALQSRPNLLVTITSMRLLSRSG